MAGAQVSIIMAAYNAAGTIAEAITSIQNQTFSDWELIVVDDASLDDTATVVRDIAAQDPRVHLLQNLVNRGSGASRNRAWRAACSDLIAVLDADDISFSLRLEKQVKFLASHPDVTVLGSGAELRTPQEGVVGQFIPQESDGELRNAILRRCPFVHSTVVMRRTFLESCNGYDESLRRGQDFDLWVRGLSHGRYHNLTEPLVAHRLRTCPTWHSLFLGGWIILRAGRRMSATTQGLYYAVRYWLMGSLRKSQIVPYWRG